MKNQKSANIIERTECKSGVVLYELLSSDGVTKYFVTVKDGKVDEATHQDCPGFAHNHRCYHLTAINAVEGDKSYNEMIERENARIAYKMSVGY